MRCVQAQKKASNEQGSAQGGRGVNHEEFPRKATLTVGTYNFSSHVNEYSD